MPYVTLPYKPTNSFFELTTDQYIIQVFNERWAIPRLKAVTCRVTTKDFLPLDRFDCMFIDWKYIPWTCDTFSKTRKQLRGNVAKILNGREEMTYQTRTKTHSGAADQN